MKNVPTNGHISEPESLAMFPDLHEQHRILKEATSKFPLKTAQTQAGNETALLEEHEVNLLNECIDIPEGVYDLLPSYYTNILRLFPTQQEKQVFLCGMLPTIAALLPNVQGAHADGFYDASFYLALVAGAGQGKGTAAKAFELASGVDTMLQSETEQARLNYEAAQKSDEGANTQPPPDRCLIVPANASSIALIQTLYDNGGRALLAETEIDSLLASDRNTEWGNVSSILRSAFHHETISVKRKGTYRGKTTLSVKHPALSVFLSGTPHQFKELMHSTENGLFSRFAVLFHNPPMDWRTHRPTPQSREREQTIRFYAELFKSVYDCLIRRNPEFPPVQIELSEELWDLIDSTYSSVQQEFYDEYQRPDLLPSARRGAIIAFRLAIQFTVLRWIEDNSLEAFKFLCKEENPVIQAGVRDVECGVMLARVFTSHAHALSSLLPQHTKAVASSKASLMRFLEALPEEFTTDESVQIGEGMQLSRATVFRYVKQLSGNYILPIRHGKYQKLTNNLK
jgi:hypothetical protein